MILSSIKGVGGGVLDAGPSQKKWGHWCGHNPKKGGGGFLGTSIAWKKGVLITDILKREGRRDWSCTAYLLIILTFTCQHYQPVGMCSGRLKGRTGKDGSPSPTLGTIIKNLIMVAVSYFYQFRFKNFEHLLLGSGGTTI